MFLRTKKHIGDAYELEARQYLQQQGLKFLAQNVRFRTGEIDLIMKDRRCIVFVEVRFRQTNHYGGAGASISLSKQKKLLKTAFQWLALKKLSATETEFRFDAMVFEGKPQTINWIKNIVTEG